jgi:hypothetical protein
MRATFLIALVLLLGTQAADARHYRFHYWHRGYSFVSRHGGQTGVPRSPEQARNAVPNSHGQRTDSRVLGQPFPPSDWRLQPVKADQRGRGYLSPDGAASLAFDASPASSESASEHLKAVAFVDGEQLLTLVGTQSELLVTGTKDHRTFIRKARLACGGREWHQVTLEFPTGAQREYAQIGERAVRALELADDDGCGAPIARNEPPGAGATPEALGQTRPSRSDAAPSVAPASPSGAQSSEPNSR